MAELAKKQLRKKIPELELALEGKVEEHHRFLLRVQLRLLIWGLNVGLVPMKGLAGCRAGAKSFKRSSRSWVKESAKVPTATCRNGTLE
jgi:hypothetical protein